MNSKKGEWMPIGIFVLLVAVVGVLGFIAYKEYGGSETASIAGGTAGGTTGQGEPLAQLAVLQVNKYSQATEGGDDLEFWDKGADITDTSASARETIDLTSGAATDTSVPSLRSLDTQATKDLYIEGTGNYYDDLVPVWSIDFSTTGASANGALNTPHPANAVEAVDVGTFADIDLVNAAGTGFAGLPSGQVNYSDGSGADGGYFRLELGNDEIDSELRDVVLCIGDADSDLEGDEITALTASFYTGKSIGSFNTNLLQLFRDAAGTGNKVCTPVGDIINDGELIKGVYQFDFVITEANTDAGNEELEIGIDDLGDWNAQDYPSRNRKATAEDITVAFVA